MRALPVTLLAALLTVGTAQAVQVEQALHDAMEETHRVCSTLDTLDSVHEVACIFEACALPNKHFPELPDEVLPVHVNVDQCIRDLIGDVDPTDPLAIIDAARATAAAG